LVDTIISKDEEWRKQRFILDNLNKDYNVANKQVALKKKESKG
jgi:seryl-tRNA synthetase